MDATGWLYGKVLDRALGRVAGVLRGSGAQSLYRAAEQWASALPSELEVKGGALATLLDPPTDQPAGPVTTALRERTQRNEIPSRNEWTEALLERWKQVGAELGNEATSFFSAPQSVVRPHLEALATCYHQALAAEHPAANAEVLARLDRLLEHEAPRDATAPELSSHLREARSLLSQGRPTEALSCLDAASKTSPDDRDLLLHRSSALVQLERLPEALRDNERAVELAPGESRPLAMAANLQLRLQRYQEAFDLANEALRHDPDDSYARVNQAAALTALGRPAEALEVLRELASIEPESLDVVLATSSALGYLCRTDSEQRRRRHAQESLDWAEKAIRIDPRRAEAWCGKSAALGYLGEHEEELAAAEEAIALDPKLADAYLNKGCALAALGDRSGAYAAFDRATELRPGHADTYYDRANTLAEAGDHEAAILVYDRALEIDPSHGAAHFNRGNSLADLDRHVEALESYDHAARLNPDLFKVHYNRGMALMQCSRFEEAAAAFDRVIELEPDDYNAYVARGHALRRAGRATEAIASYRESLTLHPRNSGVRAILQRMTGKVDAADESGTPYERCVVHVGEYPPFEIDVPPADVSPGDEFRLTLPRRDFSGTYRVVRTGEQDEGRVLHLFCRAASDAT